VECPIADDTGSAVIEVEYRREAQVHADRAQLAADQVADLGGLAQRTEHVAVPPAAELAHRRDAAEALAKTLHAAALVVHADQQLRAAQRMDLARQRA
jgi:hypothetical protein